MKFQYKLENTVNRMAKLGTIEEETRDEILSLEKIVKMETLVKFQQWEM